MLPDRPATSLLKITYLIYALHIFSAVSGLLTPAFILTAFLSGWPSLLALLLCYIWRNDAENSFLKSHFDWLIATFWKALCGLLIAWLLVVTIIGAVIGIPLMLLIGIWILYRLCKGLFALNKRYPVA